MPTYEIFFGSKGQAKRVKAVIEYAKAEQTTDAACNVMEIEVKQGACIGEHKVVVSGPTLNAIHAGYLAAVADGIILERDFRHSTKGKAAEEPEPEPKERWTFKAQAGERAAHVAAQLHDAGAKYQDGPSKVWNEGEDVRVTYWSAAGVRAVKDQLNVLTGETGTSWLRWILLD